MIIEFDSLDLGLRKNPYKGLQFYDLTNPLKVIVNATFALSPEEKATMRGSLSFDRHEGSTRYDNEVVISLWSTDKPIIEKSAENGGYFRLEIPVQIFSLKQLIDLTQIRLNNFLTSQEPPVIQKVGDVL